MSEQKILEPEQQETLERRRALMESIDIFTAYLPTIDKIQSAKSTVHISEWKDKHKGETCAILGNGESVLEFPKVGWKHPILGMNRSWEICMADYHCMIDRGQFLEAKGNHVRLKHLFVGTYKDTKYEKWRDMDITGCTEVSGWPDGVLGGFSLQLERYGAWMPSTMHFALQLAVYMGFQEIRIWGLDLKDGKFYARWNVMQGKTIKKQNIQFTLAAMSLCSRRPGLRIINMNPDSACTAFEKVRE